MVNIGLHRVGLAASDRGNNFICLEMLMDTTEWLRCPVCGNKTFKKTEGRKPIYIPVLPTHFLMPPYGVFSAIS